MIFDWADVVAVGLAMRDIANEDDGGYTPSFRTASYTVEARYAHHVAIAAALREAFEAGTNEATQEAYDAGHEDGRSEAEHAYGPECGDEPISAAYYLGRKAGYEDGLEEGASALFECSEIGDGPWETK